VRVVKDMNRFLVWASVAEVGNRPLDEVAFEAVAREYVFLPLYFTAVVYVDGQLAGVFYYRYNARLNAWEGPGRLRKPKLYRPPKPALHIALRS
jgi:hypothetical protein